ncbi:MAG: DUF6359 domain-containing protein [Bacteroidales bacterium]
MNRLKNIAGMLLAFLLVFTACNNVEDNIIPPGVQDPNEPVTLYFQDFNSVVDNGNISLEGWKIEKVKGDRDWQGKLFDDNGYAQASAHNGTAEEYEYWLISPGFNVKDAVQKTVSFKTSKSFWQNTSSLEVYAMVSNEVASEKRILDVTIAEEASADNTFILSGDIDLSNEGDLVYIGFRYQALGGASNSTTFRIDDFSFGGATGNEGPVGDGDGSKENPYTVSQAIAAQGQGGKWVEGYIVGAVNSVDNESVWSFTPGSFVTPSNILIAQSLEETEPSKLIHVQLSAGSEIRSIINLVDNEARAYHKKVAILGDLTAYFGKSGLKNTTEFTLEGYTPPTEDAIFAEKFATGLGQFVGVSVTGDQVWGHDSRYGALMTGYVDGTNHVNEDWLISPEIDLAGYAESNVSFDQAFNFGSSSDISLWVSDKYTAGVVPSEWTKLDFTKPDGSNWNVVNSGKVDLSNYADKKIRIALRYESTTKAGTWQVKNFIVGKEKGDIISGTTTVEFASTPASSVLTGAEYNYSVKTSINNASGATIITAEGLPEWASLTDNGDGTAIIAGTAPEVTEAVTYNVTLTATNNSVSATQAFTLTVTLPVDPTSNMLANGDFELWPGDGAPASWSWKTANGVEFSKETAIVNGGVNAVKVLSGASAGTSGITPARIQLEAGDYTWSFWYYVDPSTTVTNTFRPWGMTYDSESASGQSADVDLVALKSTLQVSSDANAETGKWIKHEINFTMPKSAWAVFEIRTYKGTTMYFDDCSLLKK